MTRYRRGPFKIQSVTTAVAMKDPEQISIGEVDPERKSLEVINTMTKTDMIRSTDVLMDIEKETMPQ